jgi:hypothetical protein
LSYYIAEIKANKYEVAIFVPDVEELNITDDSEKLWLEFVKKFVDKTPYDFENLGICQPIEIITGVWIGKKGDNATQEQICQELFYNHLQYTFPKDVENIGYKANVFNIQKYVIQFGNIINCKNI